MTNRCMDPQWNILQLRSGIFQSIVEGIEDSLSELVACADDTKYELSISERGRCLRANGPISPVEKVLRIWSSREMTIHELSLALRLLHLERPLRLLIDPEPLILVSDLPAEIEIDEGDTFLLQCEAEGFPYPKYGWLKGDGPVPIVTNQTGRLEITGVGLNDTGEYICRIHNAEKDVIFTRWCNVQVNKSLVPISSPDAPKVQDKIPYPKSPHFVRDLPGEVIVYFGQPLHLSFEVLGPGPMSFQWCKGGVVYGNPTAEPVLHIPAAQPDHSETFKCTVTNNHGETKTRECKVRVKFPVIPQITKQPTGVEVCVSGIATFCVEVVGSAGLHYQWMHQGQDIPGECNAILQFHVTGQRQAGSYVCRIYNDLKNHVITKPVHLKVQSIPKDIPYTATDKVALILGQSSYRSNHKPLPAVKNDMYDIYDTFTKMGFKTFSFLDNSLADMNKAIDMVCSLMQGKGNNSLYVVLYFLGHGFCFHGNHYLLPHHAMEGIQVSRCLCTEDVELKIVQDLDPIFLFVGHDLCRKEQKVMPEPLPARSPLPLCKRRVMFFAASYEEEALEEQVNEYFEPEDEAKDCPRAQSCRSNSHLVRGIFSRQLMKVLRKEPRTRMSTIYELFSETFLRPDPLVFKKEMTPEFCINLPEYNRSLGDGILCEGQETHFAERLEKWQKLNWVPPSRVINLIANIWSIRVTFHQRGSNILEMRVSEIDYRSPTSSSADTTVKCYIIKDSIPTYLCPFEEYPTDDPKTKSYIFFNIQSLPSRLEFILRRELYHSSTFYPEPEMIQKEDIKLDLGYPLIRRMWSSHLGEDYPPEERVRAGPCEQSEQTLSSIESSC